MKRKRRIITNSKGTLNLNMSLSTKLSRRSKLWLGGSLVFLLLLAASVYIYYLSLGLPSLATLEQYRPKLVTKVYSADGKLIKEFFEEKRTFASLDQMPDYLWKAALAREDRAFFHHWGMNLKRLAKAAFVDLITLSKKQGASTLTQQLARQLYLRSTAKTWTRKIRESITALQIERTYTKPEILEMYLNHMYFGHGAYGVAAASQLYFNKHVRDLSLEEAAMLIGILQLPERYSPYVNPEVALKKRNVVLKNMLDVGYIDQATYEDAVNKPLSVVPRKRQDSLGIAPYFTEWVRIQLQKKYGMDLYRDGLSVYTTLDTRVQTVAEEITQSWLNKLQKEINRDLLKSGKAKQFFDEEVLQGRSLRQALRDTAFVDSVLTARAAVQVALVALDPRTGHILAMIGGRNFVESKFNRATQARRQPGSAFKPFVYTAAIDNGYPPTTRVLNQPVVVYEPDGKIWNPSNYDGSVGGLTTFREGLARSINLVTIRVVQDILPNAAVVVDYARRMGLTTPLPAVDAIALGAGEVIPLELTAAYGAFANQGVLVQPIGVLRIEDRNGRVIEETVPRSREVLRKETAYIMTDMLKSVITEGTGGRTRWMYHFYRPAAGKTGTTNDYTDAWFVGFTPQIAAGVWVGFDDPQFSLGKGRTGAKTALPIWAPFMKAAHDTLQLPVVDFPMPEGVVRVAVCDSTGYLPNPECPKVVEEVFEKKLAPQEYCPIHTSVSPANRSERLRDRRRARVIH